MFSLPHYLFEGTPYHFLVDKIKGLSKKPSTTILLGLTRKGIFCAKFVLVKKNFFPSKYPYLRSTICPSSCR